MTTLLRAFPAFMRCSLAVMFHYRGEIILWAVWGVVYPAVATALWSAAAAGRVDGANGIGGFGARDFAAYFLVTMVVGHFCTAWDLYEMGWYVQSGRMSTRLLRPMLPIWSAIADNCAYKVLTLAVLFPVWIGVAWFTGPQFTGNLTTTLLGIIAALLGAALNFVWGYNLALAAFWFTKMDAIAGAWHGMSMFFGGRIAPLTILPVSMQWIAFFLPFKWFLWFPSATLTGSLPLSDIYQGLLSQFAWLAGGVIVFRLIWNSAVRRYTAVGA